MSYSSTRRDGMSGGVVALIVFGVIAVAVVAFVAFAPYYFTHLWWFVRINLFWGVPLVAFFVLAFVAFVLWDNDVTAPAVAVGLVAAAVALAFVPWLFAYNYLQARTYAASVEVTDAPSPRFDVRPPFTVAEAQVRSSLGDVSGDTQTTMYVPEDRTFSTLVETRGTFAGYQTLLEQAANDANRLDPTTCDFAPEADRRLGGVFGNSLERAINTEQRNVSWDYDDAYGWCDPGGTPFVVIPLVELEGAFVTTEKPAGVAVYDGRTGDTTIRPDGAGLPGPTYPLSLAAQQREATHALGSWWEYVTGRVGWETPDEIGAINSSNASEFVLKSVDDGARYATPLSGRGSATALSALSSVPATMTGRELAPISVHRLEPTWQSPTAITDNVRGTFGDVFMSNPGADISELAPTGPNTWVATIGRPQQMLYRVTGTGDLSAPPTLVALDGREIRSGGSASAGASDAGSSDVAPAPADGDLATLTPEQLADLSRRANEELLRRLGDGG